MKPRMQAVAVLLFTPKGIPLVMDKSKPTPHYWKLPGGKGILKRHDAKNIALGKLVKEIGISLSENDLALVHTEDRGDHDFSFFTAQLITEPKLRKMGRDGEEIRLFQLQDIINMKDFFPNHRRLIQSQLV